MQRSMRTKGIGGATVAALLLSSVVAVLSTSAAQAAPLVPPSSTVAQTTTAAPTLVAAAKARPSVTRFTKKINAYAKKRARAAKVTSAVTWPLPVKTSAKRDWWVQHPSGKGYKLGNATIGMTSSQATVTRYRKAVVSAFTRYGLKGTGGTKDGNGIVTKAYANSRYACTVKYETMNRRYSSGASFWCTTKAQANTVTKRVAPFRHAYRKTASTRGLVFSAPSTRASSSPTYRGYWKASVGIMPMVGVGGFNGKFAKAPGKGWQFVLGLQGMANCDEWERTSVGSRAFAGETCWRIDHEDRVQPR